MSAPPSTSDSLERLASVVDGLAVVAGLVGALTVLGGVGPLPDWFDRARTLVTVGSRPPVATGPLTPPAAWAMLLLALSALAAFACWTRRRWLVWTLAGVAGVAALLGVAAGALSVVPVAVLLSVAAGLRSLLARREPAEQPDVTL